jgi:hypothetical protein
VLRHVFAEVTRGASEPMEQHLALLAFLQQLSFHNPWVQPMHRDRSWVCDPLALLELNEMRCGAMSTLAADLFRAAGYEARLTAVGGHTIAEIRYEGAWHYFDADLFGGGQSVLDGDGTIPSLAGLAAHRDELDRLGHSLERSPQPPCPKLYPSSVYFSRAAYRGDEPAYLVKRATPAEEAASRFFGWEGRRLERLPAELDLDDEPIHLLPDAPRLKREASDGQAAMLRWAPVDGAAGYRVLVAERPRGWQPGADRWRAADYDALFATRDVRAAETAETEARIELEPGRTAHVAVAAIDARGLRIGKESFLESEELELAP